MEKGRILYEGAVIEFAVRRRRWRRTISLLVDPHEGVYLRAPMRTPVEELGRLVCEKARWILDKLKEFQELEGFRPRREFVPGESFLFLGRRLILDVLPANGSRSVSLLDGRILVFIEEDLDGGERAGRIRELLHGWYRLQAHEIFSERLKIYSEKTGIFPSSFRLGNAVKRWGSCNGRGEVRVSWQVVMAPPALVDYVIVHELCHLKHCNHSRRFWKLVGSILPDYEKRRERLRREGPLFFM